MPGYRLAMDRVPRRRRRFVAAIAALVVVSITAAACSAELPASGRETEAASSATEETAETTEQAAQEPEAPAGPEEIAEGPTTVFSISGSAGPPVSAVEAFEMHGSLEQEWTGPPHRDLLCGDFPAEHVLAVLGRSSLTAKIDGNRCLVDIDDGHYLLRFATTAIDTEEDFELWVGTASIDDSVPLDVADVGLTSTAILPMAAVRDESVFWFVGIDGASNANEIFTTDTDLLRQMFIVLTSRWSFDTQVGDVLQWTG